MYPTGDLNQDGIVDSIDLSILVSNWNTSDPTSDINNDGIVDAADLSILVSNWGETSGGSAEGTILLVTNEAELSIQNQPLYDRLTTLGYTVITRLDSDPVDYDGIDLIVFGTVTNSNVDGRYTNPPIGMVFVDSFRHFGLGSSIGFENNVDTLEVTNSAHPLSGGLSNGTHVVYNTPGYLVWSTNYNQATAIIIATNPGESNQPIVFGYEAGDNMQSAFATTRHIGLGLHKDVRFDMTSAGWALFDAAITWAKDSAYVAPPPPSAPTNLTATAGDMQVSLSWSSVSGADSYSIKRSSNDGGPYTSIQTNHTTTSYTDTNLTNGTTYYYVVSAINSQGESDDSTQVSATPAEGSGGGGEVERLGLFVTQAELSVWRERAVNGPYKDQGDANHPNSPGDWSRIVSNANSFDSNPPSLFDPDTNGGEYDSKDSGHETPPGSISGPHQLRDAGFRALVDDNVGLANKAMTWLFNQSNVSQVDFSNTTIWPRPNHHPQNWFRMSQWLGTMAMAYDWARAAGGGTSSERDRIEQWLEDGMMWLDGNLLPATSNLWTDRWTFSGPGSMSVGYNNEWTHSSGFESHTYSRRHDNQRSMAPLAMATIALILGGHSSVITNAKQWCKEWLFLCVHGNGDFQEMHRGWGGTSSESGYHYTNATFSDVLLVADALARVGDFELYEFSTRGGFWNTACESGDPNKTLLNAALGISKYANDGHERYHRSSTNPDYRIDGRTPRDNPSWRANRETHLAVGNKYWNSADIEAAYLHDTGAGYLPYWSPSSAIAYADWSGRVGVPGYLFMYGGLEHIKVHPGN